MLIEDITGRVLVGVMLSPSIAGTVGVVVVRWL